MYSWLLDHLKDKKEKLSIKMFSVNKLQQASINFKDIEVGWIENENNGRWGWRKTLWSYSEFRFSEKQRGEINRFNEEVPWAQDIARHEASDIKSVFFFFLNDKLK